jgi:hypothetical protein
MFIGINTHYDLYDIKDTYEFMLHMDMIECRGKRLTSTEIRE